MKLKYIILFLIWIFSANSFSQKAVFIDSILQHVKKEKNYTQQIKLLEQAIESIHATKYEETISLAHFGIKVADKKGDKIQIGYFYRNIGNAWMKLGAIDSASVYYYRSLEILQNANEQKVIGALYDDLARMHRKLNQNERAISFYDKALLFYEKRKDLEGIARINNESGIVYQNIGDLKTANERFLLSLQIQEKRKDSVGISYALEFLGQNQMLLQNYENAKDYFLHSLAIRERLKDIFPLMLSYTSLGELYKETGQYSLSNEYFQKSNQLAMQIQYPDIRVYNYGQIEENYMNLKDFQNAYYNLKEHSSLNDSLYNINKIKAVEDISTKYETVEKEKKILEQRAEIAENQLKLQRSNLFLIGFAIFIVFILLFTYLLIDRQKSKHERFKREAELKETQLRYEATQKLQEERLRISRDLHDNIGAQLAFIISALDNLSYSIQKENPTIKEKLSEIKDFTSGTIGELRDTIWAMHTTSITMEDLLSRVANFTEKAKQFYPNTEILFIIDEQLPKDIDFGNLKGLNIFRIIQEAINNSLKYAEASQVVVNIRQDKDLHFTIQDNGKGFNEEKTELGNGLNNMRKRAIELGTQLSLTSSEGKGTSIELILKNDL
ncbi:MAG: hypothetical protein H3C31_00245 [Brumimicrobium sp.]|nr:hypothetical protein [Brumimicrobium sp.]MCO5268070.1 sensor histidine kinase [Brumimicrobium sp.]